jgi:hypothetical protein
MISLRLDLTVFTGSTQSNLTLSFERGAEIGKTILPSRYTDRQGAGQLQSENYKMLTVMVSNSNLTPITKIKFYFEYLLSLLICMPNQVSSSLGIAMA